MEKSCPLKQAEEVNDYGTKSPYFMLCEKEQCAWWDDHGKECAILKIAQRLMVGP